MNDKPPTTVAAMLSLPPDSWVNEGFTADVTSITPGQGKNGRPYWKVELHDPSSGAQIKTALFTTPRFSAGQSIEVTGQGIKYKNGQYGAEVSIGEKATIRVVNGQPAAAPPFAARPATPQPVAPRPIPATPAPQGGPVNGQTVGMAIKEALALHGKCFDGPFDLANALQDVGWWVKVENTAQRIIAISRGLESGKGVAPKAVTGNHPDLEPQLDEHGNPF